MDLAGAGAGLVRPGIVGKPLRLPGIRAAWVSSCGVAPGSPGLISPPTGTVSVPVSILECQLVVTLASTLLLVVVAGVAVARIVVLRISTVTAAVISSSSQDVLQTEEPHTNSVLTWSLASPPAATVTAIVVATKQSEQASVCIITIGLSFPSAAGVVVVAVVVVV